MATRLNVESQKLRFILVGGANTTLDFGVLLVLSAIGLPTVLANICSTSVAFCFSFFANKKFTFKTTGGDIKREVALFIIVTLIGLWGIQSAVIAVAAPLFSQFIIDQNVVLIVSKLLATASSLVWNYVMYSRVVFKRPT